MSRQSNAVKITALYERLSRDVEQQGESRAKYGRQIIKNLSEAMNTQFGR